MRKVLFGFWIDNINDRFAIAWVLLEPFKFKVKPVKPLPFVLQLAKVLLEKNGIWVNTEWNVWCFTKDRASKI